MNKDFPPSPAASQVLTQVSVQVYVRPALTPRQTEVLRLLANGKTPKQIGSLFGVGAWTIRYHIRQACERLDAVGPYQAVAKAVALGLVTLS